MEWEAAVRERGASSSERERMVGKKEKRSVSRTLGGRPIWVDFFPYTKIQARFLI